MGAQKGKDLLLKLAAGEAGSFVTVAGLRSRRLAFNSEAVDVTDSESAGRWRELLAGSGVRRASLGGSGIFKDADSDALMRALLRREHRRLAGRDTGFRDRQRAVPDHDARIHRRPRWRGDV
jgi:TP901-1 family phage major tail protein